MWLCLVACSCPGKSLSRLSVTVVSLWGPELANETWLLARELFVAESVRTSIAANNTLTKLLESMLKKIWIMLKLNFYIKA